MIPAINQIPENLMPYIQARSIGNISTNEKNDIKEFCLNLITYAHNFIGAKDATSSEVLFAQTKFLINDVLPDYKLLTKDEISLAFKKGLKNDFGQFMGLNPKTYHFFLKSYVESEERKLAIKYLLEVTEPVRIEKTKEEKDAILKDAAIQYFNEYKQTGIYKRHYHSVLDYITELKGTLIIINDKQRKTLITDAQIRKRINEESKKEYLDKINKDAEIARSEARFQRAKEILDLANHLDSNISYKICQKNNALKYYFDELINNGIDLKLD